MKRTHKFISLSICLVIVASVIAATAARADVVVVVDPSWTAATMPVGTTEPAAQEEDMSRLLDRFDRFDIVRMILYLTASGGSFADWLRLNYGEAVDIPESLEGLDTGTYVALAMRIFNIEVGEYLGYTTTTAPAESTTAFVFPSVVRPTLPDVSDAETTATTAAGPVTTTKIYRELTVIRTETTLVPVSIDEGSSSDFPGLVYGDVNWDGKVLANDARLALRISARLENPSPMALTAADVNRDGYVLAADARQILRYSARLQSEFV